MRMVKWVLTSLLGVLLLVDFVVAYRLIRDGWPKRLAGAMVDTTVQIRVVPIPMDAMAWISFSLYAGLHIVLCYCVWRLYKRSAASGKVHRLQQQL